MGLISNFRSSPHPFGSRIGRHASTIPARTGSRTYFRWVLLAPATTAVCADSRINLPPSSCQSKPDVFRSGKGRRRSQPNRSVGPHPSWCARAAHPLSRKLPQSLTNRHRRSNSIPASGAAESKRAYASAQARGTLPSCSTIAARSSSNSPHISRMDLLALCCLKSRPSGAPKPAKPAKVELGLGALATLGALPIARSTSYGSNLSNSAMAQSRRIFQASRRRRPATTAPPATGASQPWSTKTLTIKPTWADFITTTRRAGCQGDNASMIARI